MTRSESLTYNIGEPKMATKEAIAQIAALPERVAVVETKVDNIEEKLDDIKIDVKEMHDCLDNTRKISDLEKIKNKYTMYAMVGLAFAAGAGWINAINFPHVLKFFGL